MKETSDVPLDRLVTLIAHLAELGPRAANEQDAIRSIELGLEVERTAHRYLEQSVAVARARAVSWQEIGDTFGISRQAAFKRFGSSPSDGRSGEDKGSESLSMPTIDLTSRTEQVFRHLSRGDYAAVKSMMTFTCSRLLTKKKVMSVWDEVIVTTGQFETCSQTIMQTSDGTNVIAQKLNQHLSSGLVGQTRLTHEGGEWLGRVAFNGAGKITGILLVHPLSAKNLPF